MTKRQLAVLRHIHPGGHIIASPAGVFAYTADMDCGKVNRNTFDALIRHQLIGITSRSAAGSLARVRCDITSHGEAALSREGGP